MEEVVARIFSLTKEMGMEQKKLAEILGTTDKKVSAWKTGRSKTYRDQIEKIAEVLNTTTEYLLTGEGSKLKNISAAQKDSGAFSHEAYQVALAYDQADDKSRALVRLALNLNDAEPPVSAPSEKAM